MIKNNSKKKEVESKSWDSIPGESAKAYEAFQRYLELGVFRSLVKLSKITGKHPKNMQVWSRKYSWVKRARAYDAYISSRKTESTEEELKIMIREHKQLLEDIRNSITAPIVVLVTKLKSHGGSLEELEGMSFMELLDRIEPFVKHIQAIIKLERLLYGLPTESIESNNQRGDRALINKEVREFILNLPPERVETIVKRAIDRLRESEAVPTKSIPEYRLEDYCKQ